MKRTTTEMLAKALIDKMFEIAGHDVTYEDVVNRKDAWYNEWTMTEEQNEEWKKWGIEYLRKKKRWPKKLAEIEMSMLNLYCGLQVANYTNTNN